MNATTNGKGYTASGSQLRRRIQSNGFGIVSLKAESYLTEVQELLNNSSPKLGGQPQHIFRLMQAELNTQREAELGYLVAAKRRKRPRSR